jgi:hypothetical protein
MVHRGERRADPRSSAVANTATMEFAILGRTDRIRAQVINISRGGALVAADSPIPSAATLSLRIDKPVRTDWVDTEIVRVDAKNQIGVRFPEFCPDDLLLAGSIGIDLTHLLRGASNDSTAAN